MKGRGGESKQYAKKGSQRRREEYTQKNRNHDTREVKSSDIYLGRRKQTEVTLWKL
jgi:hypothetical protein